jgi:hypothetical protein
MTTRKLMDIAFPYFFVRRRLQPISYGPLRRDGFQDVEWLGKQYAGLSHLGYRGYMLRNLDALIKKTSRRVISASDNPNLAISTFFELAGIINVKKSPSIVE